MNIEIVNLLYKGIYLEKIQAINLSKDLLISQIGYIDKKDYFISFDNANDLTILTINILKKYLLKIFINLPTINYKLSSTSSRIINYINILELISNNDFIDEVLNIAGSQIHISYANIIADRINIIFNTLLIFLRNEKNYLISTYLLRDMIEDTKLYLYFIRGNKKEIIIKHQNYAITKEEINKETTRQIKDILENESSPWKFNIKHIITNNESLKEWILELKNIETINENCNKCIHKNGLKNLMPMLINKSIKTGIKEAFIVVKMFISLVISYDGKSVSSSDYINYLEEEIMPPESSQYVIAPICQHFINNEYSLKEKQKLQKLSYMDID